MVHKKNIMAAVCVMLAACVLTGCSGAKGKVAPQSEVDAKVALTVPSEAYTFFYAEEYDNELPKKVEYFYISNERELVFKGTSTLKKMYFQQSGELPFYEQSVDVDYLLQVQNLYNAKALAILSESPLICVRETRSWSDVKETATVFNYDLQIEKYADIDECAKVIGQLQSLYSAEQQFNTQQWVSNHPLMKVRMLMDDDEGNTKLIGIVPINGLGTAEDAYRSLCIDYALMIERELLPEDENVPKEVFDVLRMDNIRKAYIGDTKLTDNMANHQVPGFFNNGEEVFLPKYNYDIDSYILTLDCGLSEEKCNPHPLEVYIENAGGKYTGDYATGTVEWKIGKNKYRLEASLSEDGKSVESFVVYRNDEDMEINVITDSDVSGQSYLVALPVGEVARMFEFDYEIDEENLVLKFETRE